MIKVNLLVNKASVGSDQPIDTVIGPGTYGNDSSLLTNLALIIGGTVLLYLYQSYNVSSLEGKLQKKDARLQDVQAKLGTLKKSAGEAKEAQNRIVALEQRMEALKKLSKSRLSELKALDHLQTIIPDRVWLTKIKYVKGGFTFEGFSLADDDFGQFMKGLEEGGFFVNIVPVRFTQERFEREIGKAFTVTCGLGNI